MNDTTERIDAPRIVGEQLWSIVEVAHYLGLSRRTVERMLASRELPPPDLRRPRQRWMPKRIRDWVAQGGATPLAPTRAPRRGA